MTDYNELKKVLIKALEEGKSPEEIIKPEDIPENLRPEFQRVLSDLAAVTSVSRQFGPYRSSGQIEEAVLKIVYAPELAVYKQGYDCMSDKVKNRCSWETIAERLLADSGRKLKKVLDMQGSGELFGIDNNGKALFKDKGVEPVIYGFDKEGRMLKIYDRNPEQMKQVERWANYYEVHEQVLKDGYELFPYSDLGFGFSDEMKQAEKHTKKRFVASENEKEWRASWLESGDKPDYNSATFYVAFKPRDKGGYLEVAGRQFHENRDDRIGAVRLLRV